MASVASRWACGQASASVTKSRYVVAVSGGVDSVVLLHALHRQFGHNLVVAHVDHGIRPESGEDAAFVRDLAAHYDVPFEMTQLRLGSGASEELARDRRYGFLREVAEKCDGHIVTAHHADDVVETIAINLLRGTGWRGLAVFGAHDIHRPMTVWFKHEIIEYAQKYKLQWREDATNASDVYLRNRVRRQAKDLSISVKLELLALWRRQHELKRDITDEARRQVSFRRYPYIMMPSTAAVEVLTQTLDVPMTRPQLHRALLSIKAARPGSKYHLNKRDSLVFSSDEFQLVTRKK